MGNTRTTLNFSDELFMRDFAVKFQDFSGQLLSTDSHDRFVSDLVHSGWLLEQ
ncbi:hypothetical protein [Fibrisoma montanum]|uniref:hypothetical protein n=1 Tax=Fibrisoma montanum TaxID=2305895 RepID=UPI001314662A|nr:hypothetical protein [Fibrisoma montanum]